MINFAHLHVHTSIGSMQDSMARVDDLFCTAKKHGQSAIAITDHGTMAAVLDARKAAKKHGIKYIPGIEAYFVDDISTQERQKKNHMVLLAKNKTGYCNLLKINAIGYNNYEYLSMTGKVYPKIDWDILKKYSEGIICLTACAAGIISVEILKGMNDDSYNNADAVKVAKKLKSIFGEDLYIEIQAHSFFKYKHDRKTGEYECGENGRPIIALDQDFLNKELIKIADIIGSKVVCTCDVHYVNKEDASAHDMLMAINDKKPVNDKSRHRYDVEEFYLKTSKEVFDHVVKLTNNAAYSLKVCENTIEVCNKCEDSSYIDSKDIRFPKFNPKDEKDYNEFVEWRVKNKYENIPEDNAYMRFKCVCAFRQKYSNLSDERRQEYKNRMIEEMKVFELRNFCSYMLIVSDFINNAKKNGIRVGCGRGSCGSSLVANLLGIHEVDPLKFGLLFERFINKEKVAFPDIDTDFSPDGRDAVQEYIVKKYGDDHVAHVSNLSTITPKVIIKDIARSLEIGGDKSAAFKLANDITKDISMEAKTFDDALVESDMLQEICIENPDLEKYGRKLIGLEKTYATHAAGVVISDVCLSDFVPLRRDKEGVLSVQYEKGRCEDAGLIKMDLLGLEHLKIIDNTIKNIKKLGSTCLQPEQLDPFDDKSVWEMICHGNTMCVFQMSSSHMSSLCKKLRPKSIEDLSLINALGRPSAEKSRDVYLARRTGSEKVSFKYECLKEPLKETLGICVYEEQLLKLAKYVAGWSLNKADGLRKLTKLKGKDPALAEKLQNDFINDSMKNSNLKHAEAQDIWKNIIEPFAGYGFNKAHGIFYSINGYQTAYYKCHYPAAFMAAVLQSEVERSSSDNDKMRAYKKEATRMGIKIVTPNIMKSDKYFSVIDDKTIAMGLATVKGVGDKAVENIIEVRKQHQFTSFADFLHRTNSNIVKKNVIQALAKAGCFDCFGIKRRVAYTYYADFRTKAAKMMERLGYDRAWDKLSAFEIDKDDLEEEWDKKKILEGELETIGDYISGSVNDLFDGFFSISGIASFSAAKRVAENTPVKIEAVVDDIKKCKTKSGKNKGSEYACCDLIDVNNDIMQMKIWSDKWEMVKDRIVKGKPIRAICRINLWNDTKSLVLDRLDAVGK